MRMAEAGEAYLRHMRVGGFDAKTLSWVRRLLRRLEAYLVEAGVAKDLGRVTNEQMGDFEASVREWVNRKGEPLAVTTTNGYLCATKGFFRWLREEGRLYHDPAKGIRIAKVPQRLPRVVLTVEEAKRILRGPDISTALGYRDRAILEVLYSTGIRNSELSGLKLGDVDWEEGFLRVNDGKGAKDRVVPLGRIASRYVENYAKQVREMFLKAEEVPWLFLSLKGNRMCKDAVCSTVERYVRDAGLAKHVTPHTFRHTCATLMMRNKANIRYVQELLGHASLETTQIYTAVTVADLKAEHKRCHPREREKEAGR